MKIATSVAALGTCLVLALSGIAVGQSPTQDTYSGAAGQQAGQGVVEQADGNAAAAPAAAAESSDAGLLPFTGMELLMIGLAGTVLVGTGLLLRRTVGRPSE